ncbi:pilus assembly protein PilM [Candidatus Azambacteria bacterium]|nr:pilus assembly protein PilM [Candidatus Azambacteria bacterium]
MFSSFSTIIELPPMPKDEMEKAIQFEARQYVPIPISEVSLDSLVLGEERKQQQEENHAGREEAEDQGWRADPRAQKSKKLEILLIAVPNEIKKKYEHIAQLAGLELTALEMETFPLARAMLKGNPTVTAVVDIGARSTDICIADGGVVRISHNFEFSGVDITKAYGEFAKLDYVEAEKRKKVTGLNLTPGQLLGAAGLLAIIDDIINETERITHSYFNKTGRMVTRVVLAGGVSRMPGLLERFRERFSSLPADAVSIGNPFSGLVYPRELEKILQEIGPSFAVAVGLAMRR